MLYLYNGKEINLPMKIVFFLHFMPHYFIVAHKSVPTTQNEWWRWWLLSLSSFFSNLDFYSLVNLFVYLAIMDGNILQFSLQNDDNLSYFSTQHYNDRYSGIGLLSRKQLNHQTFFDVRIFCDFPSIGLFSILIRQLKRADLTHLLGIRWFNRKLKNYSTSNTKHTVARISSNIPLRGFLFHFLRFFCSIVIMRFQTFDSSSMWYQFEHWFISNIFYENK